ncbi:hypothetical protein [Methylosinus sp. Sm6]|nr:hypothetical protein [Methylosinus sp. Sm6]
MRPPLLPLLAFAALMLIAFASLHDLAIIVGHALAPWFGWMLP